MKKLVISALALAAAAAMGVGHPHYCESYFIIADCVSAYDFD